MPSYKVPKPKPSKESDSAVPYTPGYPTVYFPVDPKWIGTMKVGEEDFEVTLKGKLVGLEMREREKGNPRSEADMEVHEVTLPYGDEESSEDFSKLAED